MPESPETPGSSPISVDDLRVLMRVAGLAIAEERVPAMLAEVNSQLAFARSLDSVLRDVPAESSLAEFDPSWSRSTTPVPASGAINGETAK